VSYLALISRFVDALVVTFSALACGSISKQFLRRLRHSIINRNGSRGTESSALSGVFECIIYVVADDDVYHESKLPQTCRIALRMVNVRLRQRNEAPLIKLSPNLLCP